jgi:hypothetical protein
MDDVLVLHHDKRHLHGCMNLIRNYLETELQLNLNPKSGIFPATSGVDFLGYKTWATHRKLRKRFLIGVKRKAQQPNRPGMQETIASWLGHAKRIDAQQAVINILKGAACITTTI